MLSNGKVYLLSKPENGDDVDLAIPGYWDLIDFDQAPFLYRGRNKSVENGIVCYKYRWAQWVVAGYIDAIEHVVDEAGVEEYESRWADTDEKWLEGIQSIIYGKLIKNMQGGAK